MFDLRLVQLRREHAWLDEQVRAEQRRPYPDALRLQMLKRRRLSVKERLHALSVTPVHAFA